MAVLLPLFPLDVVLFPGVSLPLHIFEPRYRRMLADVLAGDRRIGLCPAGAGPRAGARPGTGTIGCAGRVRESQALPDGRSNILLTGDTRFMVRRYPDGDTPYFLALVDEFADEPGTEPEPDEVAALGDLHARQRDLLRRLDIAIEPEPPGADDPVALSFQAAVLLDVDAGIKQRLLETRSTSARVRALIELLPATLAVVEAAAEVHVRATTNGKGAQRADSDGGA